MSEILKATGDQILCELILDEKSKGGIIIPEMHHEVTPMVKSRVVAIGKAVRELSDICEGDIVLSNQGYGTKIEHDGKKYLNLKASTQVAAILHTPGIRDLRTCN